MGDEGSCWIVVESFETEDFSALVWVGKSCFAELTTAFASLWTCLTSVCSVERAPLSQLDSEVVDGLLEIGDVLAVGRLVVPTTPRGC